MFVSSRYATNRSTLGKVEEKVGERSGCARAIVAVFGFVERRPKDVGVEWRAAGSCERPKENIARLQTSKVHRACLSDCAFFVFPLVFVWCRFSAFFLSFPVSALAVSLLCVRL